MGAVSVDDDLSAESASLFVPVEPGLQAQSEINTKPKAVILIILQSKCA
jgi:hypothetical protein